MKEEKQVNNLRVGTISVALLFITLGVSLLVYQFSPYSVAAVILSWWPILLILLGVEILIFLWLRRNDQERKLGYDMASIFIILLFGFVSIGLYALQETGILNLVKTEVLSQQYEVQTLPQYESLDGINKVKLIGNARQIELHSTQENQLHHYSVWQSVLAYNQEEAQEKVDHLVETQREGDTLVITIQEPAFQHSLFGHRAYGKISLYVPEHVELETDFYHASLDVLVDSLANDWHIRSRHGFIAAYLSEEADIQVRVQGEVLEVFEEVDWEYDRRTESGLFSQGEGTHQLQLTNMEGLIQLRMR